ncbi:glycosyltransferase family 4 protein [Flavobacterium humidisoli]|uniref:Glycosyltransferase family 4 protein n=1 Tax=Flavobacterium humidisoli TaxID=2937442 RepID=A0ABY4LW76_9FLAO|nr:glycosyltransferase family 4 protein [Flavobacterium humidisoli]UPZ16066.1 glycosyltransferase family 4 protein [Flavobacterium humidisoli]
MENRILFIAHDGGAYGANQSLINIVSSLKERGVFVTVVFPLRGMICDFFDKNGWDYHIVSFRNELRPKTDGIISYLKNILRVFYKKYLNSLAIKELYDIVDLNKINIIHSNSGVVAIGVALAKNKNIRHIWHLREYIHPSYGLYLFGGIQKYKKRIKRTDNIICITNGVARGFDVVEKAFVLHDAVRKKPIFSKPQPKEKYFLFCSALTKSKGVEEAIDAFSKVVKVNNGYKLLIVGEGSSDYENYLKEKVVKIGLENDIDFLGFRKDVDELMIKATAFLMCSRNEAMGRVTVESMLNFCIVFGYNDSGTAEIVEHNKTGFLYNNENELVNYMSDIITNKEKYEGVTTTAYNYAISNFLEEKFCDNLMNYYDKL